MKFLQDKYPLGSLPDQKTPGRYIDGILAENIDILAEKIVDDMQFLGLCSSSTFEVRSGKSTFMQHIGEYYVHKVNELHNLNLTFDMKNVVFSSGELIERAFQLPKYSVLIMDESDEVDESYYSKLAKDLRRFFRKSGQLNLFIILIVPNYFQLKSNYAVSRSNFLIDVRFEGKFERGYFKFYNYEAKRLLYIKGKKNMNYDAAKCNFSGRFTKGYAVNKDEYLRIKNKDLRVDNNIDKLPSEKEIVLRIFKQFREKIPDISLNRLKEVFGVSERTLNRWNSVINATPHKYDNEIATHKYNILIQDNHLMDDDIAEENN